MADTRCANPEYQLDVDIMVVEYTLYQAIEAKLKSMRFDRVAEDAEYQEDALAAQRLIESFDILVRLFRHNHPSTTLSNGTTFNIKILEFLVLFSDLNKPKSYHSHLQSERDSNTHYRRQWLQTWSTDPSGPGHDIKPYILPNSDLTAETNQITLTDLLARFMDLSAEMAESMGRVNEHWFSLAGQFMLQSAIERFQTLHTNSAMHLNDASMTQLIATWVSECFAWGYTHAPAPIQQSEQDHTRAHQTQQFISDMFRARPDHDADSRVPDVEHPSWTALRAEIHAEAFRVIKSCTNANDCPCYTVLKYLRSDHPVAEFKTQLRDFVDGIWCVNMDNISGKPVLVQIEEGGLEGLDEKGFEGFLGRVGLRSSAKGLKWWL